MAEKRQFVNMKPSSGQLPPTAPRPGLEGPRNEPVAPRNAGSPPGQAMSDIPNRPGVLQPKAGAKSGQFMPSHGLSLPGVAPRATRPLAGNGQGSSFDTVPVSPQQSGIGAPLFLEKEPGSRPLSNPGANGPILDQIANPKHPAIPASEPTLRYPGNGAPQRPPMDQPSPFFQAPRPGQGNKAFGPNSSSFANPMMSAPPQTPRPQRGNLGPVSMGVPGSMSSMSGIQAPPLIPQGTPPRGPGNLPQTPLPPRPPGGFWRTQKRRFPMWARVLTGAMVALILLTAGLYGWYRATFGDSVSQITGHKATSFNSKGKEDSSQSATSNGDILSGRRINILLLGSDNDGKGNNGVNGSPLAQTDIVVTIDPSTHYVGMLSIPRDMRVFIPGNSPGKMDFAFSYGYQSNASKDHYADAAGLAIATVQENFNIPIDYYAWVGLDGFIKVIETAGGVDVDALHPMVDDIYPNDISTQDIYGFKRLYVAPGPQHMNGIQALEYVRTRHSDLGGDFGRSVRQQQVLTALKGKLQSSDTVNKLPEYAKDLVGYLRTDMQVADVIKMANFARNIDTKNINKLILSPPYSGPLSLPDPKTGKNTSTGDFVPYCSKILPDLQKMFGDTAGCKSVLSLYGDAAAPAPQNTLLAQNNPSHVNADAPNATASTQQMVSSGAMSVPPLNDPTGVRSLLDLMMMVTFENVKVA